MTVDEILRAMLDGKTIQYTEDGGLNWYTFNKAGILSWASDRVDSDKPDTTYPDIRVMPENQRVPLELCDIKPGDILRENGAADGWSLIVGADDESVRLLGSIKAQDWKYKKLYDCGIVISHDQGKTWQPCWKEV